MSKAILVIDMPNCCDECFALDDHYDYPMCLITQEQRGYNFNIKERKMDKCPLKYLPEKFKGNDSIYYQWGDYEDGHNDCLDDILSEFRTDKNICFTGANNSYCNNCINHYKNGGSGICNCTLGTIKVR